MGMLQSVQENVLGWSVITILIVIVSIILLKFQANDSVVCPSGYQIDTSSGLCDLITNTSVTTSPHGTYTAISTTVGAIDEPISWISIVFIAVIGLGILGLFIFLMKKYGKF